MIQKLVKFEEDNKTRIIQYIKQRILEDKRRIEIMNEEIKNDPKSALCIFRDEMLARLQRFENKLKQIEL